MNNQELGIGAVSKGLVENVEVCFVVINCC